MLVLDQTCKQIKSNWGCRTHLLPQCYRDNNQQEDKYIWGRSEQENTPTKTEMCSNRWHYKKNEEDSSPWNHECKQIHLIQFFFNYLCPANSISTTSPDMQSVSCIVCVISQELGFGFVCACVCVCLCPACLAHSGAGAWLMRKYPNMSSVFSEDAARRRRSLIVA